MTDLLAMFANSLVPALALALLHFLWQGALIGLLAALALALLRNARPQARYAVACLALLACVLLPAWSVSQALVPDDATAAARTVLVAGGDAIGTPGTEPGDVLRLVPNPPLELLPWVVALWASGAGLLSLHMALGLLWVRRLCREAQAEAGCRWQACVDRLGPKLGIRRKVALRLVGEGDSPVAARWWRPVVLLPVAVAARMPADLVEALLAHELAHIRRHDYLVNLLQGIVEALLFYHPVVWWLSRRIRVERELVADDLAAAALGEPRRLALALSELDRHGCARSPLPSPHFAPAANGGHLMSRIKQLVRPDRRAIGGALVLPLAGLAIAGAAFYAQARMATPAPVSVQAAMPTARAAPAAQPLPAPTVATQALPAPRPSAVAQAVAAPSDTQFVINDGDGDSRPGYALVRKDREGFSMSGDMADIDEIRAARRSIDGDFLWFRRDGKAWIVRDPATLARVREAWAETDALNRQMQDQEARMRPHAERMEALAARMAELESRNEFDTPEAQAAIAALEARSAQMEALAERQVAMAARMQEAQEAEQRQLAREQEALSRQQEALSREMQERGATLEAMGERMKAQHAPMEALGREMEAAGKPMEAIGKDMEVLGKRIEREAHVADGEVRKLMDDAWRNGQAQPAPVQQ